MIGLYYVYSGSGTLKCGQCHRVSTVNGSTVKFNLVIN